MSRPDRALDAFLDEARRVFEQAWASVPAGDWSLRLADRPLRLRIAGDLGPDLSEVVATVRGVLEAA